MSEATQAWVAEGVRAVIGAHAQAQDAGRTDEVVALYTPDGVLEVPGMDPVEGHDGIREAFKGWAPTRPQLHVVTNTVVTSAAEDEATAVSDVAFFLRAEPGWAPQLVGRYDDTFRRVDGTWLLHRRRTTYQA
ncbi:nuclear transport factor 2 family protein [Streptomyces sp. GbtcB6]|uniref:nuclear transport factor 2 family protein n=1 Tax=Streptomyces sp. GbtcB6 TaxID=2824751 RepID=UPI001C3098D3|nr:nuclear transport factor 2 family protein [Streptomyces sp. GbtcB6]